ncbi:unnamed protein product [Lactuca virosa]|uniref:Uncharacterized protein n=1 Tax=Lactuca virosa TaxID=75947 RepID=A0AAU9LLY6_9ASTR|nr:unnamed protein product [Lactuca virosa]CAH1439510.1 unnamed protein product [Lactuca virosa]
MLLAQIGEFAFVLLRHASNLHLIKGKLYLLLLGTIALSLSMKARCNPSATKLYATQMKSMKTQVKSDREFDQIKHGNRPTRAILTETFTLFSLLEVVVRKQS